MSKRFLRKAALEEEDQGGGAAEEQYMNLFPKIGRDFVHKDDLVHILRQMLEIIDPDGFHGIDLGDDSEARARAYEYKDMLDAGKSGNDVYPDLTKEET